MNGIFLHRMSAPIATPNKQRVTSPRNGSGKTYMRVNNIFAGNVRMPERDSSARLVEAGFARSVLRCT